MLLESVAKTWQANLQIEMCLIGLFSIAGLVTTSTTGSSVLFQAGVIFSKEKAKFWLISPFFVAKFRFFGVLITDLNDAVVYQN